MDQNLEIGIVAGLIAAILVYILIDCLRAGTMQPRYYRFTREEQPALFWTIIGLLAFFIAVLAWVSVGGFWAWL